MNSVTHNLPGAYLKPLPQQVRHQVPGDHKSQRPGPRQERIIEAEWRPLGRSQAVRPAFIPVYAAKNLPPQEYPDPTRVTARYRQMMPDPDPDRGTLLDISA